MQFLLAPFDQRTKFLALFLVWTLCLGLTTLIVQHSQNPMICAPLPQCRVTPPNIPDQPIPPTLGSGGDKSKPIPKPDPPITSPKCNKKFIPIVAGAGSGGVAGAGASVLAGSGVISATITVGGAVVAAPAAVAVTTGVLVFLVVRSLTGAC
jgi:hypothetical protein